MKEEKRARKRMEIRKMQCKEGEWPEEELEDCPELGLDPDDDDEEEDDEKAEEGDRVWMTVV